MKYVSEKYAEQLDRLAETLVLGRFAGQVALPEVASLYPELPETARIYDFPAPLPPEAA